jgi:hypothetical protein
MKKMNQLILAGFLASVSTGVLANTTFPCPNAHFWQKISAIKGGWQVIQTMINENGQFIDIQQCAEHNLYSYAVSEGSNNQNGFRFAQGSDFNIAYTITAIANISANFTAKSCVFVVTANGPAQPDVHVINYNGANCDSQYIAAKGEVDYQLQ